MPKSKSKKSPFFHYDELLSLLKMIEAKPKNSAKLISETGWEEHLVCERLSILEKARVIMKRRGYYHVVIELSSTDNYELELGCVNKFKSNPTATFTTIYLCKHFVCSYGRMNGILYNLVATGLLEPKGEDMFKLADNYHVQELAAITLTNRIFA